MREIMEYGVRKNKMSACAGPKERECELERECVCA